MEVGAFLAFIVLFFSLSDCNGRIIQPSSSGGGLEGDPAPGRSPGPPQSGLTGCQLLGPEDPDEEGLVNVSLSHPLFKTDVLVPGVSYEVIIGRLHGDPTIEFAITSSIEGIPAGRFSTPSTQSACYVHQFRGELQRTKLKLNWTLESYSEQTKSNVTFEFNYRLKDWHSRRRRFLSYPTSNDCQVWLKHDKSEVSSKDFIYPEDCHIWFPSHGTSHGIVIELTRLNVPCPKGYLHFSGVNITQHQHFRLHRQSHICGKLEELSEIERHIYFPSSHTPIFLHVHGNPVFSLGYRLVDHCYNITFSSKNGSFELKPNSEIQCTFKILLPYGNRVALVLHVGNSSSTGTPETYSSLDDISKSKGNCSGLLAKVVDGDNVWSHCTRPGDAERQIEAVSRSNQVVVNVRVRGAGSGGLGFRMIYRAKPVEEITGPCGFGWVAIRQFCVSAMEGVKLPWAQAEMECGRREGHLASIRNEHSQDIIDKMLLHSPGYRDHNAYWIGASDKSHEGDFRWSDGLPFSYTNWFPGWSQHSHYNKQPNDDGLSEQDCVEVRRAFSLPSSTLSLSSSFMWNDRDCTASNYFICERLQSDEPLEDGWPPECNKTVILSRQQPRAVVSSPGFPRQYPDNADCDTYISAPPGYRLVLDFEELVLESEPSCSYDYLEILEDVANSSIHANSTTRRLCGDWSSKLKLLRHVSKGSRLKLRFSSDYSHHFGGFKARISMENTLQCADDRLHLFNNSCYLFVSYPEVTWNTAQQICRGLNANLASIMTPEEERFVTSNIRRAPEYRTSALYWLGATAENASDFHWTDGKEMVYLGWLPGQRPKIGDSNACLGIQWTVSPTPMLPSGLYWKARKCGTTGGYVCKRPNLMSGTGINFNQTVNGTSGNLTTPNFPSNYYNNLDFAVRIKAPDRTRILISFAKIDLESQIECLYDYIELSSIDRLNRIFPDSVKFCGSHETGMQKFNFVSRTNEALLRFHSDFSITGDGFSLNWKAVDISGCPKQTLTAKQGTLTSPNYPDYLLPHLDCAVTIQAPPGKRIWLEFRDYDFGATDNDSKVLNEEAVLKIRLGEESTGFRPYEFPNLLSDGTFISDGEFLKISLKTGAKPVGSGYKATYKTVTEVKEEKVIFLHNTSRGSLLHLNYPERPARNIDFEQHFIAPLGHTISLELHNVMLTESNCSTNSMLDVYDKYAETNGTLWHLCYSAEDENILVPPVPTSITTFLNTLHVRQINGASGFFLNGSLKVQADLDYRDKLLRRRADGVESCRPNPCLNDGKCVTNGTQTFCQCNGHFTGLFCALTHCDLEPCVFGTCELVDVGFKCHCKPGYVGTTCARKRRPCESNPCENRGVCLERGNGFFCRCHAWWEGPRCEKRMQHIPYKPLSERMFHEPFWLGLMTVTVVMAVIGLVWCAKRHFPEKIEKLLAEDSDRNRSTMSSLRSTSVREQLAASGTATVTVTPSPGPGVPRSLFGRLGIRKPSILSLTSPHASGYVPATARTFSLDDLLKPPLRHIPHTRFRSSPWNLEPNIWIPRNYENFKDQIGTPSPKKKRNNSTPTKKNAAEKKQILQQLISPSANKQNNRKVNLGELIQMSEHQTDGTTDKSEISITKETRFIDKKSQHSAEIILTDPKLEKKVTFARLLNKVSAEMSSSSDMELGIMQANKLGYAFARPASTPPSPIVDARSPNSTSSNQGSDSLTSSDLAIPSTLSYSISDFLNSRRHNRLPSGRQKPSSADSILAMFRNFSSSNTCPNTSSSLKVSPSTTPTPSSPQEDMPCDDESSASSAHSPISFSSGPPESPVLHARQSQQSTIEVPVLDPLSAHKSSTSGSNFLHPPTILLEIPSTINKCLSPIREMPTPLPSPMPSPALTPIMRRSAASSSAEDIDFSDDRISVELPNISISCSEPDDDVVAPLPQDIAIDPQAEDGLILEEAAVLQQQGSTAMYRMKSRPPPLGHSESPTSNLKSAEEKQPPRVIPTLTIQTPSPIHSPTVPSITFHGSPPPQRKFSQPDCSITMRQPRRMLKEFDKPTSLDLPCAPPTITITCNMSEAESDAESVSPALKASGHLGVAAAGMSYLSPFSIGGRGDHNASESNLSSSGYSSMASPGPSRCGSSNPLCPSEMEDPGGGNHHAHLGRRPSPLLKNTPTTGGCGNADNKCDEQRRGRSDSETLSDDPLLESNDEGIGTDHLEEKIEDGDLKSAKELEVFIVKDCDSVKTMAEIVPPVCAQLICDSLDENVDRLLPPSNSGKNSLQLPSIVVQYDCSVEKHLSPMSSRSESPLSDKTTGIGRFSPQFYGRNKDQLPFTDSDGLYDFPSSDKVNITSSTHPHRKSTGRRREKKSLRNCKTPSPTKPHNTNFGSQRLDIPIKDQLYKIPAPRKLSPKRRVRPQILTSSSSSESIVSAKEQKVPATSPTPDNGIRWSNTEWASSKQTKSPEASGEDTGDEINVMLPKSEDVSRQHPKISRLRAISHQIRFLRRLERSLKRRERSISPSDSLDSGGDDSPRATSPLLQPQKGQKIEIRKSCSIGKLPNNPAKNRRSKLKDEDQLIPQNDSSWKRIVITGNGYSD